MKSFVQKLFPHLVAVLSFIVISSIYFSPLMGDKKLRQGDISHYKGMAQEIIDFRNEYDEEPLWSNSMFSGMPAYQISVKYQNNLMLEVDRILKFGLPRPIAYLMMCMLGFYILFLCLKINPWLAIPFSVIAGFSTIHILYLGAGHMSKVRAISYMAPFLGGLIYSFRRDALKGAAIATFFLALHIASNHLQMTYYLLILTAMVGIGEIVRLVLQKETKKLPKIITYLSIAAIIAVLPSINGLYHTYSYGKYTMRGDSKLSIQAPGKGGAEKSQKGLQKDYILQYSLGKGEVLSMLVPNVKGGASAGSMANSKEAMDVMKPEYQSFYGQLGNYWGEQSFTAGAFYFGAFFAALFIIALFGSKDSIKWPLLAFTLLASVLSMKYAGLTETFIESFPMFSKFRDTKMMLVGVSIALPLMGAIFIQEIIDGRIEFKGNKVLYAGVGLSFVLFALLAVSPSSILDFFSKQEDQALKSAIAQAGNQGSVYGLAKLEVAKGRAAIVRADAQRSMLFCLTAIGVVLAGLLYRTKAMYIALVGGIIGIIDVWGVNKRYLNHEDERSLARYYESEIDNAYPNKVVQADMSILSRELRLNKDIKTEIEQRIADEKKENAAVSREAQAEISFGVLRRNTNYRVLNLGNTFNDARTSHYHKSIGGYHGGKLGAYQDLIDFKLQDEISSLMVALRSGVSPDSIFNNTPLLNMLNAKYAIYSLEAPCLENKSTMGNTWFASGIEYFESNDDLMLRLSGDDFNPSQNTLTLKTNEEYLKDVSKAKVQANEVARMSFYKQNELKYEVESNYKRLVVFSEIFFKEGWNVYVNDVKSEILELNYLLRGVKVPEGRSEVRFEFKPKLFSILNIFSLVGSISVLLIFGFFAYKEMLDGDRS